MNNIADVIVRVINCMQVSVSLGIIVHQCRCHRWYLFTGVNVTGNKFIAGINDIGNHWKSMTRFYRLCRWHRWTTYRECCWYQWHALFREYLREFSTQFKTASMEYSWARWTLNQKPKAKISCQTPFKQGKKKRKLPTQSSPIFFAKQANDLDLYLYWSL